MAEKIHRDQSSAPSLTGNNSTLPSLPPEALDLAGKIFDMARTGATAELGAYLTRGIPANLRNHKGDSLLMLAAYHGQTETARLLLDRGADPDLPNDRGQTPVAGAVFKGHDAVVELLVRGTGKDDGSKADIHAGHPNAVDSARMFRMERYYSLFGITDESTDSVDQSTS